ncbi:MAG: flippase [Candidatus Pacebacteria bacterium]|nr:flippase [Candidatus Paceibacterota bacterium]
MFHAFLNKTRLLFFSNLGVKQTIFKNTFWLALTMALNSIVSVFISIWIARYFGPAEYGKWGFVLSFVAFFSVFIEFGFETFIIREVAKEKGKTSFYVDNIIAIKALLSLFVMALMFVSILLISKDDTTIRLVFILGPYVALNSFTTFFFAIFRANEMMEYETLCYAINGVTLAVIISISLSLGNYIDYIGYAYLANSIIAFAVAILFLRKYFSKFYLKIKIDFCKQILKDSWPYALSSIIVSFYGVDMVILGLLKNTEQVGWYSAAYKVPLFVQMIGLAIPRSFFPKLSQKYKEGAESIKKITKSMAKVMHFLAWPLGFGGAIIAEKIMIFLFGVQYLPGVLAFQMLIWSMAINFLFTIYQEPIKASDNPKPYLYGVWGGAILSILFDFLLIPRFGLNGAAFVSLVGQIGLLFYMKWQFSKIVNINLFRNAVIPFIASVMMGLVIYFYLFQFHVLIIIGISILLYSSLYYLLFSLQKKFRIMYLY